MKNIIKISLICIYLFFLMVSISCLKKEKVTKTDQKKTSKVDVDIADIENNALEVANSWLKLVDDGEYSESWEEAAKLFCIAVRLGFLRPHRK